MVSDGGTLNIIGTGTLTSSAEAFNLITVNSGGALNVTSANLTYTGNYNYRYPILINSGGTCTINSGTITGNYCAIYNSGTLNIIDGTVQVSNIGSFTATRTIVSNSGGAINITGGTIDGKSN